MKAPDRSFRLICCVTNDLVYDQRMQRTCECLTTTGWDVLLAGRALHTSKPLAACSYQQKRLRCFFEKGKLFYLEFNLRLFLFLLIRPFDAVCAVDLDTLAAAWLASRIKRKKCIYDAHEYFTEVPEVVRRPIVKRVWEMVARILIPRTDYRYTVGPLLARELEHRYRVPFAVVRNVPPHSNPTPKTLPDNEPLILLYQGALNEGRGIEAMLEAMVDLPHCEFWLAGEGDLSRILRDKCRNLGLENKVHFWGYVLPVDLKQLTCQAHIGLNLLENTCLNYYYSLANKTFDYIQAGIPALWMDFPEYRQLESTCQSAVLIPDLAPRTIVAAIRKLSNPDYYATISANCVQAAATLHWENEKEFLISVYDNVSTDLSSHTR